MKNLRLSTASGTPLCITQGQRIIFDLGGNWTHDLRIRPPLLNWLSYKARWEQAMGIGGHKLAWSKRSAKCEWVLSSVACIHICKYINMQLSIGYLFFHLPRLLNFWKWISPLCSNPVVWILYLLHVLLKEHFDMLFVAESIFNFCQFFCFQVFDLGSDGNGMTYAASLTQEKITYRAASATRYLLLIPDFFFP